MQPNLELLKDTYENFIAHGGTRGAISKKIKTMAIELLEFYDHAQIANVFNVTDKTIRNWQKTLTPAPQFVELSSIPEANPLQITVTLPQGVRLLIPYESYEQINQIINLLIKDK
jgi:hypothetical protein